MYIQKKIIPELLIFARAQLAAFIGGLVDFACMIILTEVYHWFYAYSILASGLVGAVANFSINKYWAFNEQQGKTTTQLLKFSAVVAGSIILKSSGTYLFTEGLLVKYWIARIVIDALVCFGFNYVLHRKWVFK